MANTSRKQVVVLRHNNRPVGPVSAFLLQKGTYQWQDSSELVNVTPSPSEQPTAEYSTEISHHQPTTRPPFLKRVDVVEQPGKVLDELLAKLLSQPPPGGHVC